MGRWVRDEPNKRRTNHNQSRAYDMRIYRFAFCSNGSVVARFFCCIECRVALSAARSMAMAMVNGAANDDIRTRQRPTQQQTEINAQQQRLGAVDALILLRVLCVTCVSSLSVCVVVVFRRCGGLSIAFLLVLCALSSKCPPFLRQRAQTGRKRKHTTHHTDTLKQHTHNTTRHTSTLDPVRYILLAYVCLCGCCWC